MRLNLCSKLQLKIFIPLSVVLRQGEPLLNSYFVLSGRVAIHVKRKDQRLPHESIADELLGKVWQKAHRYQEHKKIDQFLDEQFGQRLVTCHSGMVCGYGLIDQSAGHYASFSIVALEESHLIRLDRKHHASLLGEHQKALVAMATRTNKSAKKKRRGVADNVEPLPYTLSSEMDRDPPPAPTTMKEKPGWSFHTYEDQDGGADKWGDGEEAEPHQENNENVNDDTVDEYNEDDEDFEESSSDDGDDFDNMSSTPFLQRNSILSASSPTFGRSTSMSLASTSQTREAKLASALAKLPIFKLVTRAVLEKLAFESEERELSPNQLIYSQGMRCDGIYIVLSGSAIVTRAVIVSKAPTFNILPQVEGEKFVRVLWPQLPEEHGREENANLHYIGPVRRRTLRMTIELSLVNDRQFLGLEALVNKSTKQSAKSKSNVYNSNVTVITPMKLLYVRRDILLFTLSKSQVRALVAFERSREAAVCERIRRSMPGSSRTKMISTGSSPTAPDVEDEQPNSDEEDEKLDRSLEVARALHRRRVQEINDSAQRFVACVNQPLVHAISQRSLSNSSRVSERIVRVRSGGNSVSLANLKGKLAEMSKIAPAESSTSSLLQNLAAMINDNPSASFAGLSALAVEAKNQELQNQVITSLSDLSARSVRVLTPSASLSSLASTTTMRPSTRASARSQNTQDFYASFTRMPSPQPPPRKFVPQAVQSRPVESLEVDDGSEKEEDLSLPMADKMTLLSSELIDRHVNEERMILTKDSGPMSRKEYEHMHRVRGTTPSTATRRRAAPSLPSPTRSLLASASAQSLPRHMVPSTVGDEVIDLSIPLSPSLPPNFLGQLVAPSQKSIQRLLKKSDSLNTITKGSKRFNGIFRSLPTREHVVVSGSGNVLSPPAGFSAKQQGRLRPKSAIYNPGSVVMGASGFLDLFPFANQSLQSPQVADSSQDTKMTPRTKIDVKGKLV